MQTNLNYASRVLCASADRRRPCLFCDGHIDFLAFATAIFSGLWPALQISRPNLAQLLQNGMRRIAGDTRARRTHSIMVGAQVALTVLLLTLASTAAKGFLRLLNTDPGYDAQNAVSLGIPVHANSHVSLRDRVEYFEQLRATIAAMPQVVTTAISSNATPPLNGNDCRIEFLGRADLGTIEIRMNFIGPEYFSLLHIPLLQGPVWDHPETMRAAAVAVINQSMARQYWPLFFWWTRWDSNPRPPHCERGKI
jgi:putative ABC transport system permease protein